MTPSTDTAAASPVRAERQLTGKALRTWQGLVQATREEIKEAGGFTGERVALRAGTSPATFYSYFASKDAALGAAFDAVLEELIATVGDVLRIEELLDHGLSAVCGHLVRDVARFFDDESLLFQLAVARIPENEAIRAIFVERQKECLTSVRRFVSLGQKAGQIRDDDADVLAASLLLFGQGLNNPLIVGRRARRHLLEALTRAAEALLAPEPTGKPLD